MTRTQLIELLTKTKPGYKILINPNLSEFTANTNDRMTPYAGKTLTIDRVYSDFVSVCEDCNVWSWDHNHIVKILPSKRLKRKQNE